MSAGLYTKTVYVNGTTPALSATNLNHAEDQIAALSTDVATVGTWTPTIIGSTTAGTQTYSVQVGTYIKIGRLVHVQGTVTITAKDAGIAGNVRIGGFPFVFSSTSGNDTSINIARFSGVTFSGQLTLMGASGTQIAALYNTASGGAYAAIAVAGIAAATHFVIGGTYVSDT